MNNFFKSTVSIAVWMVVFSVLIKMAVFLAAAQYSSFGRYAFFANIFFIMMGVFLAIRLHKSKVGRDSSYLDDVKVGMRMSSLYALVYSAFIYSYHSFIDSGYLKKLKSESLTSVREANPENLEQIEKFLDQFLSPFSMTTVNLILCMVFGLLYSLLLAYFMRRMKGYGH